jgi:hypothetical protein
VSRFEERDQPAKLDQTTHERGNSLRPVRDHETFANAGKESASRFSEMSSRSRGDASEKFALNYSEAANAAQR